MQELLVLSNPRRRRRAKKSARRRGKRRMSALQRKYFGGGRKRRASVSALANPAKRGRKRRYRRSVKGRIRRAGRRAQRGFMRLGGATGNLSKPFSMVGPALTGALGAIAVNSIMARVPLPAMLMTGKVRYLTQGAAAIALGTVASRFGVIGSGVAAKMAEGALTVTLNDLLKELASDAGINLGGMGYYLPGRGAIMPNAAGRPAQQMGKYLTGPGAQVMPIRRNMGNINTFKF